MLDSHQFLLFLNCQLVDILAVLIGHILKFLLHLLQVILRDLGGLLFLLKVLHSVPADIPNGYLSILTVLAHLFGQVLAALLRQLREGQADYTAIILGIDTQVRDLNRLLHSLQQAAVPWLDHQGSGIRGGDRGHLIQGVGVP